MHSQWKGKSKKLDGDGDGEGKKYVILVGRSYEVNPKDIDWACNDMVARIHNGVSVPIIQQTISNVGFHDFMMAPLYFMGTMKVMSVFNEATDFFSTFVYDCCAWSENSDTVVVYRYMHGM